MQKEVMQVATIVIPEPNDKQKKFFCAKQKHVGYGGA